MRDAGKLKCTIQKSDTSVAKVIRYLLAIVKSRDPKAACGRVRAKFRH